MNKSVAAFESIAKDYWEETFERFPVTGGWVGVERLRSELGRATPDVFKAQIALVRRTLESVAALPLHDFDGDARLDRWTLRAHLLAESMRLDETETWRADPQVHLDRVAEGIHSLVVRHADDLRPVAKALVSRIGQIPRYLDEAAECLRRPVPLWSELAAKAAPGVAALLRSLVEPIAALPGNSKAGLNRKVEAACDAVEAYAVRARRLKPGPADGFSLGTERFERLMRVRLGLDWTAREAEAAAFGLIERLNEELRREAKKFGAKKDPRAILEEAAGAWDPGPDGLLAAYERETFAMRDRFREADAMTFPTGERLVVRPVPDFMAHQFPTAAYSTPGPLDPDQTGIFWVNDMSLRAKNEKMRRAEIAQHFGMELTCAHEAYPGHHLQFMRQHRAKSLTRKLADHAIYYEGWTLWCEQMTVDLGAAREPHARLQQILDALWRANRIVVDCGLHTGKLSFEGACRRLQREVGFTRARARGDVNWYTSAPTVPMSYLLGKMELLRLKKRRVDEGGWTLKRFNDWVLGFGAIPWSWIESSGL